MTALRRKLLREVRRLRGQNISIGLVVATGVMTVVTMRGTYESLLFSRDLYYRDYRFADVWANVERAPVSLRRSLEQIPGVGRVETRVTFQATLDVPGLDVPAVGRFVSVPDRRRALLNDIHLTRGRWVTGGTDEVILSKNFAEANGLLPGDTLHAVIEGRLRALEVAGWAMSPEHTYAVPPGALYPEDERYGILWMAESVLAPAFDMEGAFNDVALTLAPGADEAAVLDRVDRVLEPWGGLGAYGRDRQLSHSIITSELDQNRVMGTAIPAIFLGIAAFLLNLVMGRLIATQRTEIAVLKAFGYSDREVGLHYLQFALVPVVLGALAGTALGAWSGDAMVRLYGDYFDFPVLRYRLSWTLVFIAAGVSTVAAVLGALGAVRRAVRLPPAEAMRPEPPARFRPGPLERIALGRILPAAGRMILRNIERQPAKSMLSAVGVAFSVAILVIGLFMFDGISYMMDLQFRVAQREDLSVSFHRPLPEHVRFALQRLPGVTRAEPYRAVAVRLRAGHLEREVGIIGIAPGAELRRIVTFGGGIQPLPPEGIVLSDMLADVLRVRTGDTLTVEVLEGARPVRPVRVAGVVEDFLGLSAYMELPALHRLAGQGRTVSGAWLSVQPQERAALNATIKRLPAVAAVASPGTMLETFEAQLADSLYIAIGFLLFFAGLIAVAVIYNGARIALSERGRELASLRVLGFSRREVAGLLLGEQAILTAVAIPLGWLIGYGLSAALVTSLQNETYRIPFIVSTRTYLWSGLGVLVSAALSAWIVRRRLDRLDLIAVLKTRE